MTANQINYQRHLEDVRHNTAAEAEAQRAAIAAIQEQQRHNIALVSESNRHNISTEYAQQQQNAINSLHYERTDAESVRHNVAQEYIGRINAQANIIGADAQRINAMTNIDRVANDYEVGVYNAESNRLKANVGLFKEQVNAASKLIHVIDPPDFNPKMHSQSGTTKVPTTSQQSNKRKGRSKSPNPKGKGAMYG